MYETDEGPDLLPATIELAGAEAALLTRPGREHALRAALEDVADDYDWILLDCPPSLGVLTVAALSAADQVMIPLQCETLSHRGVGQLLDTIHDVRRYTNTKLQVLGVLPTLYDARTRHARAVLETISETYDIAVIEPPIPRSIRFAEAPAAGASIFRSAGSTRGAEAYRELAENLAAAPTELMVPARSRTATVDDVHRDGGRHAARDRRASGLRTTRSTRSAASRSSSSGRRVRTRSTPNR